MARAALNVTLDDLAKQAGVNEKTLRRCEATTGKVRISDISLQKLCDVFRKHGLVFLPYEAHGKGPGVRFTYDPASDLIVTNEDDPES